MVTASEIGEPLVLPHVFVWNKERLWQNHTSFLLSLFSNGIRCKGSFMWLRRQSTWHVCVYLQKLARHNSYMLYTDHLLLSCTVSDNVGRLMRKNNAVRKTSTKKNWHACRHPENATIILYSGTSNLRSLWFGDMFYLRPRNYGIFVKPHIFTTTILHTK